MVTKKNVVYLVSATAILLFLFYLSSNEKAPCVPADDLHRNAATDAACGECHAMGAPLNENHQPKEYCLICHKGKN